MLPFKWSRPERWGPHAAGRIPLQYARLGLGCARGRAQGPGVPRYAEPMNNATYKKIEIVGTSAESLSGAVRNGIERASKTVKHMNWFEVDEMRGRIENGAVAEYQVTIKIGFRLESTSDGA